MSECKLVFYAKGDNPIPAARCAAHGMDVLDYHPDHNQLCPIGKIERAQEEALNAIEAATLTGVGLLANG